MLKLTIIANQIDNNGNSLSIKLYNTREVIQTIYRGKLSNEFGCTSLMDSG